MHNNDPFGPGGYTMDTGEPVQLTDGPPSLAATPVALTPQIGPAIGDEIEAMTKAYEALSPLTSAARARSVSWLSSALGVGWLPQLAYAQAPPSTGPFK